LEDEVKGLDLVLVALVVAGVVIIVVVVAAAHDCGVVVAATVDVIDVAFVVFVAFGVAVVAFVVAFVVAAAFVVAPATTLLSTVSPNRHRHRHLPHVVAAHVDEATLGPLPPPFAVYPMSRGRCCCCARSLCKPSSPFVQILSRRT